MKKKLIRKVDCIETGGGILLMWEPYDGVVLARVTVYGVDNRTRQYNILSPLITTGRCVVDPANYPLITSFKIAAVDADGHVDESDDIVPQRLIKAERLLLKDIKRRMEIWMKATPIGSYPCTLLLRRLDGEPCERCGYGTCSVAGGELTSDGCPICLGTGKKDPYFKYPNIVWMHGESAIEDEDIDQLGGLSRSSKTMTFRTVCDIHLKEGDVIVTGREVYIVVKHTVQASVGNAPVDYVLTCRKFLPADLRYKTFMELSTK